VLVLVIVIEVGLLVEQPKRAFGIEVVILMRWQTGKRKVDYDYEYRFAEHEHEERTPHYRPRQGGLLRTPAMQVETH